MCRALTRLMTCLRRLRLDKDKLRAQVNRRHMMGYAKPTSKSAPAARPTGLSTVIAERETASSQTARKRLAAVLASSQGDTDDAVVNEVLVPVLVNTEALMPGAVLKAAIASRKPPTTKSSKAINVVAMSKKAKA